MKPTTVAYRRSGHLKTLAAAQQDMYWDTMRCSQCNFLLGSLHKTNTHTWAQTWKQPLSDPLSLEASSCQMSSNVHFSVKKHHPACWTFNAALWTSSPTRRETKCVGRFGSCRNINSTKQEKLSTIVGSKPDLSQNAWAWSNNQTEELNELESQYLIAAWSYTKAFCGRYRVIWVCVKSCETKCDSNFERAQFDYVLRKIIFFC